MDVLSAEDARFTLGSARGSRNKGRVKIVLYDWPPSPFCMKLRAVLDRKGLPYERRPALQHVREIRRRGGIGKVPAVEIDGEMLVDSTDIAHVLEERVPAPAILPASPELRARCHVLEDWADEALYFSGLYFHWREPAGRRQVQRYFAKTLLGRIAFWPFQARIGRQLDGQGVGRKREDHVRRDLLRSLDAVASSLSTSSYLLGEEPMLCDFAVAAQLRYLSLAPALRGVLDERPTLAAFLARFPAIRP